MTLNSLCDRYCLTGYWCEREDRKEVSVSIGSKNLAGNNDIKTLDTLGAVAVKYLRDLSAMPGDAGGGLTPFTQ